MKYCSEKYNTTLKSLCKRKNKIVDVKENWENIVHRFPLDFYIMATSIGCIIVI